MLQLGVLPRVCRGSCQQHSVCTPSICQQQPAWRLLRLSTHCRRACRWQVLAPPTLGSAPDSRCGAMVVRACPGVQHAQAPRPLAPAARRAARGRQCKHLGRVQPGPSAALPHICSSPGRAQGRVPGEQSAAVQTSALILQLHALRPAAALAGWLCRASQPNAL